MALGIFRIPIYPIFYLSKGDYRSRHGGGPKEARFRVQGGFREAASHQPGAPKIGISEGLGIEGSK